MSTCWDERFVVVIGASSGIGRGVAERAVRAGAEVVVAARRADALTELVKQAGGGRPVATDLRDDTSCRRLAREVASIGTPIDLLLISAGMAPLRKMADTTPDDWDATLATNLVGIHRAIVSLLDLLAPAAIVAVASSEVVSAPRSHLGAYGASKAALEHALNQWREEHPRLRFSTISLGATVPTEFGQHFEPEVIMEAFTAWTAAGRHASTFMNADEVCDVLMATLGSLVNAPSIGMPRIELRPPAPPESDPAAAAALASEQVAPKT